MDFAGVHLNLPSTMQQFPNDTKFYKWIIVNGINFEAGLLLQTGIHDNLPIMSTGTHSFTTECNVFCIVRDDCSTTSLSTHYYCSLAEKLPEFKIRTINIKSVLSFPTTRSNNLIFWKKSFLLAWLWFKLCERSSSKQNSSCLQISGCIYLWFCRLLLLQIEN